MILIFLAFFLLACSDFGDRDNPLDPGADNYINAHKVELSSSAEQIMSSESEFMRLSSSSVLDPTSSMAFPILDLSSSSIIIITPKSSSSINIIITSTGLGSCAPMSGRIDKGGEVRWQFSANTSMMDYTPIDFVKAQYTWNFGGLHDDGSGTGLKSGLVTYLQSGPANASVTVTMLDGSSEVIQCATLQVNGEPISCTCDATGGDIAKDEGVATWTASCTSNAYIDGYAWDGELGVETTFKYTFSTKGESHAPTLMVGNDDNTMVSVICPTVVATDSSIPEIVVIE